MNYKIHQGSYLF